jgi:hypothetical protein
MATRNRKRFVLAGVGAFIAAGLLGTLGIAATRGSAQNTPSPTPTPSAEASAVATPTAMPTPTVPAPVEAPMAVPFGPLAAEPYRAYTGDGDCLNVRPVPGTTFQGDPRTCVPEGFLLWLYGEPKVVDGREWRYALGEGWVASEYVKPAPGAATGFGPFRSVTVSAQAGEVTKLASVSKSGAVSNLPLLPSAIRGLGDVPPAISPDGQWGAYGREERYVPTLTIRNMADGTEMKYPQAHLASWGPANRLLIRMGTNCPQQCTWTTGWIDPREGILHPLTEKKNDWYTFTWAKDGLSLYVIEAGVLKHVRFDGTAETVPLQNAGEMAWGEMSVSEDGRRLVVSPFQGAISIIDLRTGVVSKIQRAPQIVAGGRCGGGGSSLTTWLDANTVIWHESYAEKGGNGITISNVNGGGRRLIPFFTVSDIRTVAPNLVSFVTFDDPGNKDGSGGFQLTWLLDTTTNEARPVTVGAAPQWE